MTHPRIYLSSPHMGGNEQSFVNDAFATNWIAPLGPNVTGFENDLQDYLSNTAVKSIEIAALSSGTAALHLAMVLLDVKQGDEVLCQSMTFSASANPIAYQGATPVFIDSEPTTWNLCPVQLERAIKDRMSKGKKPKAIIGVHLYGMPFLADEILEIAQRYEIPLVEDSAEALGSYYKKRACGSLGTLAILSFNGNKIITTSGGGALVVESKELKEKAVFLATQARDNAPHYQHSYIGFNYRMSNVLAGIGRGQMQVLDKHVNLRRENHKKYIKFFKDFPFINVFTEPTSDFYSNHWLTCIVVENNTLGITRESIRLALEAENIESRPLWKPMHLQPVFKDAPYYGTRVAETLFEKGLCLPSGSNLTEDDFERIFKCLKNILLN